MRKKGAGLSGAQKRKKRKEREKALAEHIENLERLKLGATKLWTGLVLHHKDVFVSHVIPKLNTTDRMFFSKVNSESSGVLEYAGVNVSDMPWCVAELTSISTLELVWNHFPWGKKTTERCGRVVDAIDQAWFCKEVDKGIVINQVWFCEQVAQTNKLEFLKWAREVKHCGWDESTIKVAADIGNLEMLKYCFSNGCPCDEEKSCKQAAIGGHLDCLRFLVDKVKPSRDTEGKAAIQASGYGRINILKYLVEERKISDVESAS